MSAATVGLAMRTVALAPWAPLSYVAPAREISMLLGTGVHKARLHQR